MGILRIMAVGRSGVGKSTIGNMLLSGSGRAESDGFKTSTSSMSCTHDAKMMLSKSGDCSYVDVPGIPDTDPSKTVHFYDMIIQEAKKDLNVIFFVFQRDRVDREAYKLAEMLFRELNKSNAAKILIINDQKNYAFAEPPTEAAYEEQARVIQDVTKIEFTHRIAFTGQTMKEKLEQLKIMLSKTKSQKSEHLKSFSELSDYVEELRKNKTYQEEVIKSEHRRIAELQKQLDEYQEIVVGATTTAAVAAVLSFFTFGATLGIASPTALAAAAATAAIQIKKAELEAAKKKISKDNLENAARELEEACEQFEQLKAALHS